MADASSPDVNSGGKKNFSRRDFLKVAGLGLGALAVKPKLVEIGDSLEKEAVLMSARQFLIKNECIPPEVENVPNENKEFKFADDVLQNAIDLYERWAAENKLPDPYYHKSEVYLSRKDVAIDASRAYSDFFDFLNHVFKDKEGFRYYTSTPGGYLALFGGYFEGSLRDYVSSKVEKFGSKPFFFSREDLELGAYDVIFKNPGSPLIARVAQSVGAVNDNTVPDTQNEQGKIISALHKEVDPIWDWVGKFVEKNKKQMTEEMFLAGLIYFEKGDIAGALWNRAVLRKLAVRNDPSTFDFNGLVFDRDTDENINHLRLVKKNVKIFLDRTQDSYSPRLSANWVATNIEDEKYFAYDETDAANFPNNIKHIDLNSADGGIYHGDCIVALSGNADPEIIQGMYVDELFLNSKMIESLRLAPNYGSEKVASDLMVCYRLPQVRKILDKYVD